MRNMLEALERTAMRVPDRIAFYNDQESLTFAQLLQTAQRIGMWLAMCAQPKRAVAILMDARSIHNIPAIYGVLYAGCAYALLDISMPAERLQQQLSLLSPIAILADEKGRAALDPNSSWGIRMIEYEDAARAKVHKRVLEAIRAGSEPDDPMSILYTSGSTGVPKGSVQTHSAYIRWTEATINVYGLTEETVFGNQSPFFYANSILDIFPPVALGATVYLLPSGILTFPKKLIACLNEHHITELCMTPSSFIKIVQAGVLTDGCLPELKWGIMSGESMPWKPLEKWMMASPNASWWHFYGSTEMFSVAVGKVDAVEQQEDRLPVGRLFDGVRVLFLDENGDETSPEQPGEMYVSSPWVSSGYYRDEARTAESFVQFEQGRFYRSGDMGYMRPDGQLVVLGRKDNQIKHMGYRMELGEVETALRRIPGWSDGCVLFHRESGRIFCFFTGSLAEKEIRRALRDHLARYMVPDVFIHLNELPYTSSMKLDRSALMRMMAQ